MNIAATTRTRYGVLRERSEGFGGNGGGVPPVPIPNTEVKPASADGTWTVGSRESRSPPNTIRLGPLLDGGGPSAYWGTTTMSNHRDKDNKGRRRHGKAGPQQRSRSGSGSSSSGRSERSSGRSSRSGERRSSSGGDKTGWEGQQAKRRRDLQGAAVDLPNWIVEALARVTPKDRIAPALEALGDASAAMNEGRYHAAVKDAKRAKNLAPQDTTVRETLGLSAYRIGDWDTALSELRAYRRMAGDASHLPIEMDVLRAKGRGKDVRAAWETLQKAEVRPAVWKEGKVVYGSYLLDEGDAEAAWDLTGPDRVGPNAKESDLRVWYIAARAAARNGDTDTARSIADAIVLNDPSFPGLDELDQEIAQSS